MAHQDHTTKVNRLYRQIRDLEHRIDAEVEDSAQLEVQLMREKHKTLQVKGEARALRRWLLDMRSNTAAPNSLPAMIRRWRKARLNLNNDEDARAMMADLFMVIARCVEQDRRNQLKAHGGSYEPMDQNLLLDGTPRVSAHGAPRSDAHQPRTPRSHGDAQRDVAC